VVLVEGHPYTVLKKTQLNYVREQFIKSLEESIDSSTTSPQFQEPELADFICHVLMNHLISGSRQLLLTFLSHPRRMKQFHFACSYLPMQKYLKYFVQRCLSRDRPPLGAEVYKTTTMTECWLSCGSLASVASAIYRPGHAHGLEH